MSQLLSIKITSLAYLLVLGVCGLAELAFIPTLMEKANPIRLITVTTDQLIDIVSLSIINNPDDAMTVVRTKYRDFNSVNLRKSH